MVIRASEKNIEANTSATEVTKKESDSTFNAPAVYVDKFYVFISPEGLVRLTLAETMGKSNNAVMRGSFLLAPSALSQLISTLNIVNSFSNATGKNDAKN